MERLYISIEIDIEKMKIVATHNIPEVVGDKNKRQIAKAYSSILDGVCRSFGGVIYTLIQPRKDSVLFETDRMHALSMISRSIEHELKLDEQRNKPTVAH